MLLTYVSNSIQEMYFLRPALGCEYLLLTHMDLAIALISLAASL